MQKFEKKRETLGLPTGESSDEDEGFARHAPQSHYEIRKFSLSPSSPGRHLPRAESPHINIKISKDEPQSSAKKLHSTVEN